MFDIKYINNILDNKYNILWFFLYGSQIQWVAHENSDYDIILVVEDKDIEHIELLYDNKSLNFTIYTKEEFIDKLYSYSDVAILEAFYSPVKEYTFDIDFTIDKQKLRTAISTISDNSWVKAKKKLLVENEPYIAYKSFFHSFRLLDFWCQLARFWCITSWDTMNDLYHDIMYNQYTWDQLDERYKKDHNSLKSYFKTLAPKI